MLSLSLTASFYGDVRWPCWRFAKRRKSKKDRGSLTKNACACPNLKATIMTWCNGRLGKRICVCVKGPGWLGTSGHPWRDWMDSIILSNKLFVDEILWRDHSNIHTYFILHQVPRGNHPNESSSALPLHRTNCFLILYKWNLGFFWILVFGALGSYRVKFWAPNFTKLK